MNPDENVIGLPDFLRKEDANTTNLEWPEWRFEYPGRPLTNEEQSELDAFQNECYRRGTWPENGQMLQLKSERRIWMMQAPNAL